LSTRLLRIDHTFSMELRSGEFPGHGPKILMFCSPSHFALRQGAPGSCWKRHCSSPNRSLDGWEKLLSEDVLVPFFTHGCVLRQNCEWVHSLGWEATPHMNGVTIVLMLCDISFPKDKGFNVFLYWIHVSWKLLPRTQSNFNE
jgi:hypothetical protein